jgi:hypothetical protein
MDVGFWGKKCMVMRIHMLQKRIGRKFVKKAKFHFPAETILLSRFYYTTDVVRGFSEQNF